MKNFYTAINCMDGRVQLPVIEYLRDRFKAAYIDAVTEPGPNRLLAEGTDEAAVDSIEQRVRISVETHGSIGIAVVGHDDCAGNPASRSEQQQQTAAAVRRIQSRFPGVPVIGLWVDREWTVHEETAAP